MAEMTKLEVDHELEIKTGCGSPSKSKLSEALLLVKLSPME